MLLLILFYNTDCLLENLAQFHKITFYFFPLLFLLSVYLFFLSLSFISSSSWILWYQLLIGCCLFLPYWLFPPTRTFFYNFPLQSRNSFKVVARFFSLFLFSPLYEKEQRSSEKHGINLYYVLRNLHSFEILQDHK